MSFRAGFLFFSPSGGCLGRENGGQSELIGGQEQD